MHFGSHTASDGPELCSWAPKNFNWDRRLIILQLFSWQNGQQRALSGKGKKKQIQGAFAKVNSSYSRRVHQSCMPWFATAGEPRGSCDGPSLRSWPAAPSLCSSRSWARLKQEYLIRAEVTQVCPHTSATWLSPGEQSCPRAHRLFLPCHQRRSQTSAAAKPQVHAAARKCSVAQRPSLKHTWWAPNFLSLLRSDADSETMLARQAR